MMIKRQQYLQTLRQLKDQRLIKVITGIRRSGKSSLLQSFKEELIESSVAERQIQSINFEEAENVDLTDWLSLHNSIESKLVDGKMNYLFLDEIQIVDNFERVVNSLFVKSNVDIYMTGSNAFLLSSELATLLTGRYISIHVLPFSFAEYRLAMPDTRSNDRLLAQYLSSSAFPEAVTLSKTNPALSNRYLKDLYETIVNNDISNRYEVRDKDDFTRVVKFVFDSIGSPLSATSIAKALTNQDNKTYHATVIRYLKYLTKSYLIYPVSRYDVKGKKLLTTNDKYYVVDLGLREIMLGSSQVSDIGHRLENVVYLELLRRNEGEVWVGKTDDSEVDFIVQKPGGEREYYQVAYQINDNEKTLERELAPFKKINDNYPKYILTTDLINEEFLGIKKVNVVDWLLKTEV
ncbi:ATP-binding protein [Candidatus Saccharibacteria bacterium]|nr:MAG: ATP-binding protein [Candidatus Saccharibacteria bacterium]